jgi:probable rRNA maturation factor
VIDIVNESGDFVDEISVVEQARFVLGRLRIHRQAELSIAFVDEAAMADLHLTWMDEPGPTDVMSFPQDDLRVPRDDEEPPEGLLGDIVICPAVARRQAATAGHSERQEVTVLLTHGILHLLGYDHAVPEDERLMFGLQNRLVAEWTALAGAGEAPGALPDGPGGLPSGPGGPE